MKESEWDLGSGSPTGSLDGIVVVDIKLLLLLLMALMINYTKFFFGFLVFFSNLNQHNHTCTGTTYTYRATYVNFVQKSIKCLTLLTAIFRLDFKMFLSQFPCVHQRHGQQTHYLQQMQRDCVWYFFLQASRFSSLLTSSPQPCTPSRQRGGSRRESTGTHTKLRAIFPSSFNSFFKKKNKSSRLKIVVFFFLFCWNDDYTRIHPPHR